MTSQPRQWQSLQTENRLLKAQLKQAQQQLHGLRLQYQALEEDFLHLLKEAEAPNLGGKKIAYIGGHPGLSKQYKAIIDHYKGQMILLETEQPDAIMAAIAEADEVFCSQDCPNKALCEMAQRNCQRYNKPLRTVVNSSPQSLQQQLTQIAIEITPNHPPR